MLLAYKVLVVVGVNVVLVVVPVTVVLVVFGVNIVLAELQLPMDRYLTTYPPQPPLLAKDVTFTPDASYTTRRDENYRPAT